MSDEEVKILLSNLKIAKLEERDQQEVAGYFEALDVIGAQRAFTNTLSGVVSNSVMLVLTLAAMIGLSWQITALALVLLPIFVLPARRMGARIAQLQRMATELNHVIASCTGGARRGCLILGTLQGSGPSAGSSRVVT